MRLVFDIETDGLLDELTTIHSLVIKDHETKDVLSFCDASSSAYATRSGSVSDGLCHLATGDVIVGHNIIKFDVPAIQKVHPKWRPRNTVRDTLVLSRLIKADIKEEDFKRVKNGFPGKMAGRHSLESWGYRMKKWKGDYAEDMKAEAKKLGITDAAEVSRFVWGKWSPAMQSYCEQDVEVTDTLLSYFEKILADGWSEECVELEHEVQEIILRQERYGFGFDIAKAAKFEATLIGHRQRLEDALQSTFTPKEVRTVFTPKVNNKSRGYVKGVPFTKVTVVPFNASSRQQVADRLMGLGWEPDEFGKDGIPTISDDVLKLLPYPEAKALAEYFTVDKRLGALSTGKQAWLKAERKGRIHGEVATNGAVTGRMTHMRPNMAQVPAITSRKTGEAQPYGKECRELFIAAKGKVLVDCDADALELRDLAGYMARYDGGAYVRTILEGRKEDGTDMHSINAAALGCSRDTAKVWFYAFIYGAGDYKLGLILGVTGTQQRVSGTGKASRRKFLKNLPALGKMSEAVKEKVNQQGYIKGLDGRKLRIRKSHAALNTLLQSAGAIQMKKALVILDKGLQECGFIPGTHYEFTANIHDEWVIEVDEGISQKVGEMAADAIKLAGEHFQFRCPLKGNFEIGRDWSAIH